MDIKSAKAEIKNTVKAYMMKDKYGSYIISREKQRPIFLLGGAGLGKTAIMDQVAREMGIGLVAYSITHHTRQSALGLPYLVKKKYGDREYQVTEYTMSEIIASVYEKMESTGHREGILFIDEINCASETLAPAMLELLQNKTFGVHEVPEGWTIVTAGNPPEYNKSVREFDVVTLDRLKKINIDPDFNVWKEYAYENGVHQAVMSYLELKTDDFYRVVSTGRGRQVVTARAWEDLSIMIKAYEKLNMTSNYDLICQYIQHDRVAGDFAAYLELYYQYEKNYNISSILMGEVDSAVYEKSLKANFDEKMTLVGLLLGSLTEMSGDFNSCDGYTKMLFDSMKKIKESITVKKVGLSPVEVLEDRIETLRSEMNLKAKKELLKREEKETYLSVIDTLGEYQDRLNTMTFDKPSDAFKVLKEAFEVRAKIRESLLKRVDRAITQSYDFLEKAFKGEDELMVVFTTELTMNYHTAMFISQSGNIKYYEYNRLLFAGERDKLIERDLRELDKNLGELEAI